LAGEVNTWTFVYTGGVTLPKGARLKFDICSQGREIDWQPPSANLKRGENVIYACLDNGKVLSPTEVKQPNSFVPQYEFILPAPLEAGSPFRIVLGTPLSQIEKKSKELGNRAQCTVQRRKQFLLYIDPSGKGRYQEQELFTLDIRGNSLRIVRILTPSLVSRNKRFDVIVRFEDEFGNLTSNAADDVLIELSHEHLRENLKWKLFVPETGFITLPNLYFNEAGVYTLQLLNTKSGEIFKSAPIKCFSDNDRHLFWGLLHGESERVDSTENVESCLRFFRDDRALNFFGSSPFESSEETPSEVWKLISQNIMEFDETDRFVTLLGFQWVGEPKEEGVRLMIYAKDGKSVLRKKDQKYSTLKKIYKNCSPKELLAIPCFTMGKGQEYNFDDFSPEFERVVEIYNAWGSSECTEKEGNPRPISFEGKTGVGESHEGSIQKALQNNCRFGFVAGGLDDRGIYEGFFEGNQLQYSPGLTAIIAAEHSRTALLEAIYNRSCYATTGERIILGLHVAGAPMGTELTSASKPGLMINRHLSGYVAGTVKLASVEIIRNGKVLQTFKPTTYWYDFTYDDMTPLEQVAIKGKDKKPPFVYYYLRVIQEDGHMGWTSPIWVDLLPPAKDIKRQIPLRSPTKERIIEELEIEGDEELFEE
jgi:hypothetical protein